MTEKRWLYFALGMTTVISIGAITNQVVPLISTGVAVSEQGIIFPDFTVQTTASPRDPRLAYYLTTSGQGGSAADSSCDAGFHFASLWEIKDVSNLRYDTARGLTQADSGSGPPTGQWGWVRTGAEAQVFDHVGLSNCTHPLLNLPWSSSLINHKGTMARLETYGYGDPVMTRVPEPWRSAVAGCNLGHHSWCVEDYPGAAS